MEKGVIEQLDNLFEEMPDANQISPERWIDLFSVRSRLTNYYAPEQARVDQYVISFMPLIQKDVLNLLFGLSEADKKNGKMFKQLIQTKLNSTNETPASERKYYSSIRFILSWFKITFQSKESSWFRLQK